VSYAAAVLQAGGGNLEDAFIVLSVHSIPRG
jgi:hypothetical protein